jgi:OHCU decarboxylase
MTLAEFNSVPRYRAEAELIEACGSRAWVRAIAGRRPFQGFDRLLRAASEVWWSLDGPDWREAFAAHPKIGERKAISPVSAQEQSGMRGAAHETIMSLDQANREYLAKFGHIFIVCASGKSAGEMLAIVRSRLPNSPEQEIRVAAGEQQKITRLRLERLFTP